MLAMGTRYPTIKVLVLVGIFLYGFCHFRSFYEPSCTFMLSAALFFVYQKDRRIALRPPRVNSVYRSTSKLQDYTQIDAVGAD